MANEQSFSMKDFYSLFKHAGVNEIELHKPFVRVMGDKYLNISTIAYNGYLGFIYFVGTCNGASAAGRLEEFPLIDIYNLYEIVSGIIKGVDDAYINAEISRVKSLPEDEYIKWLNDNLFEGDMLVFKMKDRDSWREVIRKQKLTIEDIVFPNDGVYGYFDNGAKYVVFQDIDRIFLTFADIEELHAEFDYRVDEIVTEHIKAMK